MFMLEVKQFTPEKCASGSTTSYETSLLMKANLSLSFVHISSYFGCKIGWNVLISKQNMPSEYGRVTPFKSAKKVEKLQ